MNGNDFENKFWIFYLELEQDFLQIEKTIPYDVINKNTFSYKYMGLLLSICSEIDFIFKKFIDFKDDSHEKNNIIDYERFIERYYPNFKNSEITGYKYRFADLKLKPFKNWDSGNSPKWWQVYNKIKHNRIIIKDEEHEWYLYANQNNVLKALGALFILDMYFYREFVYNSDGGCKVPLPQSEIFNLENWGNYRSKLISNMHYLDLEEFMLYYNFH